MERGSDQHGARQDDRAEAELDADERARAEELRTEQILHDLTVANNDARQDRVRADRPGTGA